MNKNEAAWMLGRGKTGQRVARLLGLCVLFTGCGARNSNVGPSIEFTKVPLAGHGGPDRLDTIEGRVIGARPGEQIVLFARWGPWWVQPLADQPFTIIQPDSRWKSATHLGTEYAAVLVDPGYRPRPTMDVLPSEGAGVIAVAITKGRPVFWESWWFLLSIAGTVGLAVLTLFRLRVRKVSEQLSVRLEERVGERTRIARDLHDTLLQSFHGLLLRFQTASELFATRPAEAKRILDSAIEQAAQAITEGRDAVQGLRSSTVATNNLALAINTLGRELAGGETNPNAAEFNVGVEGTPRDLHPVLRDEVYRIVGEALRNAFRHAEARRIEVEIRYDEREFRMRMRDDGKGIDSKLLNDAQRPGHYGMRGMRERAKLLGGKLAVWSEVQTGTEVELSIPAANAYAAADGRRRSWLAEKFAGKLEKDSQRKP